MLDWQAASIQLPLDAFGMTGMEQRLARSAQSLVWARCVSGTGTLHTANKRRKTTHPLVLGICGEVNRGGRSPKVLFGRLS